MIRQVPESVPHISRVDILVHPDTQLRVVSQPIQEVDDKLRIAFQEAVYALDKAGGVGLSGIQIGIPYRFFLMKEGLDAEIVLNPSYEGIGELVPMNEGCLSFPGFFGIVQRYQKIRARYDEAKYSRNEPSTPVERVLEGLSAQIFQHESEHLDGKLLIDHLDPTFERRITSKLTKWKMKGIRYP